MPDHTDRQDERDAMVNTQLRARGIYDQRVLDAMRRVPRHRFVPPDWQARAYHDAPLPIGEDQTISQPYIVALMTQLLHLNGTERVLEIGTGSGYQTAILCQLAAQIYSLERFETLAEQAADVLHVAGCDERLELHIGDGSQGLPDMAPFDAIIVTAAAPSIPAPLRGQLHPQGGRLVIPVGDGRQQMLALVTRDGGRFEVKRVASVSFVPLIGMFGFNAPI